MNEICKGMTGYPSIDKPWMKYYSEDAINSDMPRCTLYGYIYENNKDYADRVALNYVERKITYGELFSNIEKASKVYARLGVVKGDIITICAVTVPETIYTLYGLNRLGVICNMVDPRTSEEGINEYLREVNSKIIVTIDVAFEKIKKAINGTSVEKIVVISPADSLLQPKKFMYKALKAPKIKKDDSFVTWNSLLADIEQVVPSYVPYTEDAACVIVHTGGTTGIPKGVVLTNDNMNAAAFQAIAAGFDFKREHSWLNIMPPFIAYGVGNGLHLPLAVGMEVILIPAFNPNEFPDLMNKYHPNHMVGVPSHYGNIIRSKKMNNQDLSYVIAPVVGGDAMDISLEKEVNIFFEKHNCSYPVCKGYGMSEVAAAVCACSSHECNKIGSVGTPWPKTVIAAFDIETGKELKYGEEGEICISGPNTMLGYYNNEIETQKVIKQHDDGRMWVHSGDVGYVDSDGFVFIKDRIKRMIVRHDGFKIFPSMLEQVVALNENIELCCVVGVSDTLHSQGKLPIAFVVARSNSDIENTKSQIIEQCKKELPEYAQPIDIKFIDSMPLTAIGKVDYRKLEEL